VVADAANVTDDASNNNNNNNNNGTSTATAAAIQGKEKGGSKGGKPPVAPAEAKEKASVGKGNNKQDKESGNNNKGTADTSKEGKESVRVGDKHRAPAAFPWKALIPHPLVLLISHLLLLLLPSHPPEGC